MKRMRLPRRSETADNTTAPMTPASSISAPMMPTTVVLKPLGSMICSTQVVSR